jgi:hypothetical protein
MLRSLFISGNYLTRFGWYFHPSSGAHTTVSTASGICHTVTAICRYQLEELELLGDTQPAHIATESKFSEQGTHKSTAVTSEPEVTFQSDTFQKLRPVLKFPFKTAGRHSTRAQLLINPASHHGVVYPANR